MWSISFCYLISQNFNRTFAKIFYLDNVITVCCVVWHDATPHLTTFLTPFDSRKRNPSINARFSFYYCNYLLYNFQQSKNKQIDNLLVQRTVSDGSFLVPGRRNDLPADRLGTNSWGRKWLQDGETFFGFQLYSRKSFRSRLFRQDFLVIFIILLSPKIQNKSVCWTSPTYLLQSQ